MGSTEKTLSEEKSQLKEELNKLLRDVLKYQLRSERMLSMTKLLKLKTLLNNQSTTKESSKDHTTLKKSLKDQLKTRSTTTTMLSRRLKSQLKLSEERESKDQLNMSLKTTLNKESNIQ